ncbi:unnamed protein product [Ixodes persulcatus]
MQCRNELLGQRGNRNPKPCNSTSWRNRSHNATRAKFRAGISGSSLFGFHRQESRPSRNEHQQATMTLRASHVLILLTTVFLQWNRNGILFRSIRNSVAAKEALS